RRAKVSRKQKRAMPTDARKAQLLLCLLRMRCMTPLSSVPERLRRRPTLCAWPNVARAPSVGDRFARGAAFSFDAAHRFGTIATLQSAKSLVVRQLFDAVGPFCLRVCGCAPSAA